MYEIFAREFKSRSTTPTLTISTLGRCSLNRAAAAQFDKEAIENVLLLWDKDNYQFAIRPITKKDARSFNIRYSKDKVAKVVTGAGFSGVMFLKHIGYDYSTTQSYPIQWNAEESIFEVKLPQERFQGSKQLVAMEGGKKNAKTASGD